MKVWLQEFNSQLHAPAALLEGESPRCQLDMKMGAFLLGPFWKMWRIEKSLPLLKIHPRFPFRPATSLLPIIAVLLDRNSIINSISDFMFC